MKKSFKAMSLGVAALSGLILNEINNSSVAHADTIDTAANKTTAPTAKVTDEDISNAQKKVDNSKKDVDSANGKVDQAQKAVDQHKNDVLDYQKQKPISSIDKAENKVEQAKNNEKKAENDITSTQQNIVNQQTKVQTAQNNLNKAQKNVTVANEAAKNAQNKLNKEKSKTVVDNHIVVSQSYIDAAKKFYNEYIDGYNKYESGGVSWDDAMKNKGTHNPNFTKIMKKVSDDSYRLNHYKSNKDDKHINVDLDHITNEQNQELSAFAMNLINDVREKVDSPKLILNQDVINMAQDIAKGYIADNRSLTDGGSHDPRAINEAAKKYDLSYIPTNIINGHDQRYENLYGFTTNGVYPNKNPQMASQYDWYSDDSTIKHIVTMDFLKKQIFYNTIGMIYYDFEWDHAFSLLELSGDNVPNGKSVTPKFGLSLSVLPNSNTVSTHYIIVNNFQNPSKKYFESNTDIQVKTEHQKHDEYVNQLTSEANTANTNLTNANTNLINAKKILADNQDTLVALQKTLSNKQELLKTAKQDVLTATKALDDIKQKIKSNPEEQKAYKEAITKYNEQLAKKKQALTTAESNLIQAKSDLKLANNKLKSDIDSLNKLQEIQEAQKLADETQNQDNNQSSDSIDHGTTATTDQAITNSSNSDNTTKSTTSNVEDNSETVTLTHNAYVYDKQGAPVKENGSVIKLLAGSNISAWLQAKPVTINGKKFYQIGENKFVKVANTVLKIELTHNAYIYDKQGNVVKNNGAIIKLFTGSSISAWLNGKTVTINGKKFYQIGENEYVKVANTVVRDHAKIKLSHNARVYVKKHGKVVKKRLIKKGKVLKAMRKGRTVIINGKQYYQIAKNEYIKAGNAHRLLKEN